MTSRGRSSDRDSATELSDRVRRPFAVLYGRLPTLLAIAPGRVNVIDEHVDDNGS